MCIYNVYVCVCIHDDKYNVYVILLPLRDRRGAFSNTTKYGVWVHIWYDIKHQYNMMKNKLRPRRGAFSDTIHTHTHVHTQNSITSR
jgi:hypothetical protein